jgi:hypothetical protein
MDETTQDTTQGDNTETGADFDEGALMAAAAAAVEGEDSEGDSEPGESAAGDTSTAQTSTTTTAEVKNLDELRAIAAERAKARGADVGQSTQAATTQAQAPDLAKLTEAMTGAAAYREAIEAAASGDFSRIAKLAGKDEATLYETWTRRAMKGDAHAVETKIAELQAKIAELEGKKLPDDVLTSEKLQAIEAERYAEKARADFKAYVKSPEQASRFPILSRIDADVALQYGLEADGLLEAAGLPRDFDTISTYTEKLLTEKFGGLLAQQQDGRAQQQNGATSEAAATSATSGSTRTGVTIDNRAAAETASALPDYWDESAFVARARKVAESL